MGGQHTPGPWATTSGNLIRVMQKGTGVSICGVHRIGRARNCPEADAVPIANARLIAAAPELLYELEKARGCLNACYVQMGMNEAGRAANLARFDAAIAKARGQ